MNWCVRVIKIQTPIAYKNFISIPLPFIFNLARIAKILHYEDKTSEVPDQDSAQTQSILATITLICQQKNTILCDFLATYYTNGMKFSFNG